MQKIRNKKKIENIDVTFKQGKQIVNAVKNVNLNVEKGGCKQRDGASPILCVERASAYVSAQPEMLERRRSAVYSLYLRFYR